MVGLYDGYDLLPEAAKEALDKAPKSERLGHKFTWLPIAVGDAHELMIRNDMAGCPWEVRAK